MKDQKRINKLKNLNGVDFLFPNGKAIHANLAEIPDHIKHDLILHGLSQKIGDSYSGAMDTEAAYEMAAATWAALQAGQWATRTQAVKCDPVDALARATGRSRMEAETIWAGMDEDKKKAVRKNPQFKAAEAAIIAEQAAKRADGAEDLDGLFQ